MRACLSSVVSLNRAQGAYATVRGMSTNQSTNQPTNQPTNQQEAESKAKHQQLLSGVGLLAYWLSNFLWDLLSWLPPLLITLGLLYAFGIKTYTEGQAAGAFVALFLAFAPAATAFTYVWTFCFASHSAAQTVTLFLSFLTGLVLSITSIVLSLIDSTRAISLKLRYVFRLFPAYCFGDGLLQLAFCVDDVCPKVTRSERRARGGHVHVSSAEVQPSGTNQSPSSHPPNSSPLTASPSPSR